jgi:4'-phosphopantetheinyl transferase
LKHKKANIRAIYPVILRVPAEISDFKPKERVAFLSRHARRALEISAVKSGISMGKFKKDGNGAPLPFEGIFWSLTHKRGYVGGVVAPAPIGIDIEEIKPCSQGLFKKTAAEKEWALTKTEKTPWITFFRYWTSKEAVLKACGTGIKDLLKCRIHRIIDDQHLEIVYRDGIWQVEHFFFDSHIASIVDPDSHIDWAIVE